ncbi:YqzE family protein [Virgibacillus sp. LDC-1]|nr:YqzE family protein [Virgibacillus sp. LDC-1]
MSGDEYVKYLAGQFIAYLESTPEERKQQRVQQKNEKKKGLSNRWFGLLPFLIQLTFKKRKKTNS